ncbi:MAG TPA: hypothetical protein VFV87_09480 [Pirellulaceae bacterium]|nr:hypothetical protein [Pirellulaceae bacterium]
MAALPVVYFIAFLVLLQPYVFNAIGGVARAPAYRIRGQVFKSIFKPINDIDQAIRPGF